MSRSKLVLIAVLINCFACGKKASSTASAPTFIAGTVAQGTALAAASITIKDSVGKTKTASASSSGTFSIDVSDLSAPFVLIATGSVGGKASTLVSCEDAVTSSVTNYVNITPWTTGICAMLSSTGKAVDLDPVKDKATIISKLTLVDDYTKALLAPTLTAAGYGVGQGPIATAFAADGTGYDSIYDNLSIGQTANNVVFMSDINSTPVYSYPAAQSTTNPNLCGSDIATGAPILCNSTVSETTIPPANTITLSNAYNFGCTGCIYWGTADDFSGTSTQTPMTLTKVVPVVVATTGTSGGGSGSSGGGSVGIYYYANWSCNGVSGCIADFGANTGSDGPMCTISDCNTWGNKYISGGYSCSTTATYTKNTGTPANGTCYQSGVDF